MTEEQIQALVTACYHMYLYMSHAGTETVLVLTEDVRRAADAFTATLK